MARAHATNGCPIEPPAKKDQSMISGRRGVVARARGRCDEERAEQKQEKQRRLQGRRQELWEVAEKKDGGFGKWRSLRQCGRTPPTRCARSVARAPDHRQHHHVLSTCTSTTNTPSKPSSPTPGSPQQHRFVLCEPATRVVRASERPQPACAYTLCSSSSRWAAAAHELLLAL